MSDTLRVSNHGREIGQLHSAAVVGPQKNHAAGHQAYSPPIQQQSQSVQDNLTTSLHLDSLALSSARIVRLS